MKIVLISVGVLMISATVLPVLRADAWWIRIFDFPRLQIAIIAAAVLAFYFALVNDTGVADHAFITTLSLSFLYQIYMILPYTPLYPKQVQRSANPKKESSARFLFANVLKDNRNAAGLKQIIRSVDPDIIVTAEPDSWWQEQLNGLERTHPKTVRQPQDNCYGMLLYSRLELINPQVKFLVENDIPSIHTRVKLGSGREIELRCVHPRPPVPQEHNKRSTERDAELLVVGKEVKEKKDPVVVLGDLNDVAWSRTTKLFQNISGLLDPRIGRGFYPTFHAKYPFIRFPLDHFFHSKHFRLVALRRLPYFGSDHFPVFIELSYEPDAETQHEEPQADNSEHEEAQEKIDKVR